MINLDFCGCAHSKVSKKLGINGILLPVFNKLVSYIYLVYNKLVSILRAKFCKIVMKCKIILLIDLLKFLSFWPYFSKCTFLRLQHFFLPNTYPVNLILSFYLNFILIFIRFISLMKHFFPSLQLLLWQLK